MVAAPEFTRRKVQPVAHICDFIRPAFFFLKAMNEGAHSPKSALVGIGCSRKSIVKTGAHLSAKVADFNIMRVICLKLNIGGVSVRDLTEGYIELFNDPAIILDMTFEFTLKRFDIVQNFLVEHIFEACPMLRQVFVDDAFQPV